MNIPVGVTATIEDRVRQSSDTLSTLSVAIYGTTPSDLEMGTSLGADDAAAAAAELEKIKAGYGNLLDALVTVSNRVTASYHMLVEMHGDCERWIKKITALDPSNSSVLTGRLQLYRFQKARVERRMLATEKMQYKIWKTIQSVHVASM